MSGEAASPMESMHLLLRALKLPSVARHAEEVANKAEREGWSFGQYLRHLLELEVEERRRRRIERNLRDSALPGEKSLGTLDRKRLPAPVGRMLPTLCEGAFVERGDNVLLFGLPGRGFRGDRRDAKVRAELTVRNPGEFLHQHQQSIVGYVVVRCGFRRRRLSR